MAPHSSTLAWKIPWMEEPGRLQSVGSLRVGHDWETSLSLFTFMHWRRKWQPTPVFLPGESQGQGAWRAAIYGVTQSRTQLKGLSSSSSSLIRPSAAYSRWNSNQNTNMRHIKCPMMGFPGGSLVKNLPANAGDSGLIPEQGRSPEGGNGNPHQYSC